MMTTGGRLTLDHQMSTHSVERRTTEEAWRPMKIDHCSTSVPTGSHPASLFDGRVSL